MPLALQPTDTSSPSDPEESPPSSAKGGPSQSSLPPPHGEGLLWRLGGVLKTIRPHQWVKNVFVLAPIVFAKEIFAWNVLTQATAAFAVFCLLAGAVYTINDIADIEADRVHPV